MSVTVIGSYHDGNDIYIEIRNDVLIERDILKENKKKISIYGSTFR